MVEGGDKDSAKIVRSDGLEKKNKSKISKFKKKSGKPTGLSYISKGLRIEGYME
jgi:hypothetical protein